MLFVSWGKPPFSRNRQSIHKFLSGFWKCFLEAAGIYLGLLSKLTRMSSTSEPLDCSEQRVGIQLSQTRNIWLYCSLASAFVFFHQVVFNHTNNCKTCPRFLKLSMVWLNPKTCSRNSSEYFAKCSRTVVWPDQELILGSPAKCRCVWIAVGS